MARADTLRIRTSRRQGGPVLARNYSTLQKILCTEAVGDISASWQPSDAASDSGYLSAFRLSKIPVGVNTIYVTDRGSILIIHYGPRSKTSMRLERFGDPIIRKLICFLMIKHLCDDTTLTIRISWGILSCNASQ